MDYDIAGVVGVRKLLIVFYVFLFVTGTAMAVRAEGPRHVDVLRVKGVINPVSAAYVERGIRDAARDGAVAVVIQLDTPGGLDSSMREIIGQILQAKVPVVVYISPAGARAASAGTFITLASHVAAMAPNTTTGAAHPVGGGGEEISGPMNDKVTNDAVGYIRTLASQRQRNADWAEKAVRDSVVLTENEAVQNRVVDLVVSDLPTLLERIDGRQVELASGSLTLQTREARLDYVDMDAIESFLFTISDPNIAYILMSVAMTGLLIELSNPGALLPGIVGGIALLLALYSLGMLPVNYAGLALIAFAFILFLAEVKVQSHGLLTGGGVIALTLGSLMLINSSAPYLTISRPLIGGVVVATTAFFVFVVGSAVRAQRRRPVTGLEGLMGQEVQVRAALDPAGFVFVEGERWEAVSQEGKIEPGERVVVTGSDGLRLQVARASDQALAVRHR